MLDYHYHLPFSMNRLSDIPSPRAMDCSLLLDVG